jgi:hypothetical protein
MHSHGLLHRTLLQQFAGTPSPAEATYPLLRLLPPSHAASRRHGDVAGAVLDELVRRLDGEPIAFSLTVDRTWSAMSFTGEYSAHGDTLDEVLDELLPQLPPVPA